MKRSGNGNGHGHHKNRKKPESRRAPSPDMLYIGTCPEPGCGKHRFISRREARAAWKVLHRYSPMSVYKCGEYWHYGHNWRKSA